MILRSATDDSKLTLNRDVLEPNRMSLSRHHQEQKRPASRGTTEKRRIGRHLKNIERPVNRPVGYGRFEGLLAQFPNEKIEPIQLGLASTKSIHKVLR